MVPMVARAPRKVCCGGMVPTSSQRSVLKLIKVPESSAVANDEEWYQVERAGREESCHIIALISVK